MNWESKFSNIVRETEDSLEKIKQRLGTARTTTKVALNGVNHQAWKSHNADFTLNNSGFDRSIALRTPMSNFSFAKSLSQSMDNTLLGSDARGSLDQSPVVASILQEKLEEQNKSIEKLKKTVRHFEEEKEDNQRLLRNIKTDLELLNDRVLERGIDLQTERKIEQWRKDMNTEMSLVHSQLQHSRNMDETSSMSSHQMAVLIKEFQNLKGFVTDEMEEIRKTVERLSNRVGKIETRLTTVTRENEDLSRRHNNLERTVELVDHTQIKQNSNLNRSLDEQGYDKRQVQELKNSMLSLRDKVAEIETNFEDNAARHSTVLPLTNGAIFSDADVNGDLLTPDLSEDISESSDVADHFPFPSKYSNTAKKSQFDDELDLDDLDLSDADSISLALDSEIV